VSDGSADDSAALLAAANPTVFVTARGKPPFGQAVAQALRSARPADGTDEWLWLLRHDSAPESGALAALLAAVEIAPSVAVAGPKLMRWDRGDVIADYGQSLTRGGASVALVVDELDQGQHDRQSDLLGVAAEGMLVRRSVFVALGGFDPALPSIDAALDFCVRVRLAGHRVVGVPDARVTTDGGPEKFSRPDATRTVSARIARAAELHRRLVQSSAMLLSLRWLMLVPTAVVRSAGLIAAKRPWAIPGEFAAAFATAFGGGISAARANLARSRVLGSAAIAPFFVPSRDARELRAIRAEREIIVTGEAAPSPHPGFFSTGGAWVVLLLAAVGVIVFFPLLGATAVSGGGLLPLSTHVAELWSHVGYGWRSIGTGFVGAADPFAIFLAVVGSLFFWSPPSAIVVLYLVALPLAGLGAWFCAARLSQRGWAPAVAAIVWAIAPPFVSSLTSGHLGPAVAHLLLPWLVLAAINAGRSWSALGAASLLFAATVAAAPVLAPALLTGWLISMVLRPLATLRLIGIPVLAAVLFAPLVIQQLRLGNPLGILADPGVAVASAVPNGWQLALGSPTSSVSGWDLVAAGFGIPSAAIPVIVAAVLAPFAVLAILALFFPASRRTIPALVLALLGFVTAVASTHLAVAHAGSSSVTIWAGSGLSLYWLGLLGSAIVAIDLLASAAPVPSIVTVVGAIAVVLPLAASPLAGTSAVTATNGRMLPAFVAAEAATDPSLGTLILSADSTGSITARLERGAGTSLDAQSTIDSTSRLLSADDRVVATLAANLSAQSGLDPTYELDRLHIAFVLVPHSSTADEATRSRIVDALEANPVFTTVGETARGQLWHYLPTGHGHPVADISTVTSALGTSILVAEGLVLAIAVLLAIPTGRRKRFSSSGHETDLTDEFDEDEHD
jgi:GT2 family glycosyltransferase